MEFFCIVGSNNPAMGAKLRDQLIHSGIPCELRHVVSLDQLVDRVGLESPNVLLLDQPDSVQTSVQLLQELSLVSRAHVIAIGPADDPKRIISVMQAGAQEYIDSALWQPMLIESLARIRTRNQTHATANNRSVARVIGFLSASGGCGGSTAATNVATVLAGHYGEAMLVDLRLQSGDLAAMLDLRPLFNLADLSTNIGRLDDSLFHQILTQHSSGVHLLAAPQDYASIDQVTLKGFRRALAMGMRRFPYIVLDLGDVHSQLHQEAALRADVLVIMIRLDYPAIRNARRHLEQLLLIGVTRDRIQFVVNRYGESSQLSVSQAQDAIGCKLEFLLPNEPASVNWALNMGKPIVTAKPRAKVSRRLIELAESLNGKAP